MYLWNIAWLTEEINFAFTLANLILSIATSIDTVAMQCNTKQTLQDIYFGSTRNISNCFTFKFAK